MEDSLPRESRPALHAVIKILYGDSIKMDSMKQRQLFLTLILSSRRRMSDILLRDKRMQVYEQHILLKTVFTKATLNAVLFRFLSS